LPVLLVLAGSDALLDLYKANAGLCYGGVSSLEIWHRHCAAYRMSCLKMVVG